MFHLKEGDEAPKFIGVDQEEKEIKLEDYKGKKVILFLEVSSYAPINFD